MWAYKIYVKNGKSDVAINRIVGKVNEERNQYNNGKK